MGGGGFLQPAIAGPTDRSENAMVIQRPTSHQTSIPTWNATTSPARVRLWPRTWIVPAPARRRSVAHLREAGTATAEYAVAMLAACGFAGLLLVILRSAEVRGLLTGIIRKALAVG
jgi:hypothetical protein